MILTINNETFEVTDEPIQVGDAYIADWGDGTYTIKIYTKNTHNLSGWKQCLTKKNVYWKLKSS
jgi:hypothetical protein